MKYLLHLDQGIINYPAGVSYRNGQGVGRLPDESRQVSPRSGRVEQESNEVSNHLKKTAGSNHTISRPVGNAIVWQEPKAAFACRIIRDGAATLAASYLAGFGVGFWNSISEFAVDGSRDRTFKSNDKPAARRTGRVHWNRSAEQSSNWKNDT